MDPNTRTTTPYVTGTSVIAIKYRDGVMMASDTLASYGSLARFRDFRRIRKVNSHCMIGASGDISDLQQITRFLENLVVNDFVKNDGAQLSPNELHQYLRRVLYSRRMKLNPYWNNVVVAGFHDGKTFLGLVDMMGSAFEDSIVTTNFGAYMALPLLRQVLENEKNNDPQQISEEEARTLLEDSMRVLFYRDCRASNRIQIATVSENGVKIDEPYELTTKWTHKGFYRLEQDRPGAGLVNASVL